MTHKLMNIYVSEWLHRLIYTVDLIRYEDCVGENIVVKSLSVILI